MKITRRTLAQRSLASLIATPALVPAKLVAQAPTPGDEAKKPVQGEFQASARELAAVKLLRSVEPASRFEA